MFSIRVYVQEDIVSTETLEEARRCHLKGEEILLDYKGFRLEIDADGRLYLPIRDRRIVSSMAVPPIIRDKVEEISWLTNFSSSPLRARGLYRLTRDTKDGPITVHARIEERGNDHERHTVILVGKDILLMQELYDQIRAGKILPEVSWEEKQISRD